jgi:pectate lyase
MNTPRRNSISMVWKALPILLAGGFCLGSLACNGGGQGAKATGSGGSAPSSGGNGGGGATAGSGGTSSAGGSGGQATTTVGSGGASSGGSGAGGFATGGTATVRSDTGGQGAGGTLRGTGGAIATGGLQGSGGSTGAGGSTGGGGTRATGGAATGGRSGSGGATGGAGGGTRATGGTTGAGGTSVAAGGAGGGTTTGTCSEPPSASPLLGWASQPGAGYGGTSVPTTTGGGSATPVTVTSLSALNSAAGGTTPAVIYVKGVLQAGTLKVGSNKTIAGICGAEIHGHVSMSGSVNVIFRNLKVVGYNCSDSPSECKSGADAITVVDNAHHIWFDHCDISDGSDGNLDTTNGSDFVTVSWTKFSYSSKRSDPSSGTSGHRFSNLIGAADAVPEDAGHLNITWHHNWWADNIDQRMPRSRAGKIHVVNNLFTASGNSYCTNSGYESSLLVENNVYIGVNNPLQEDSNGNMLSRNNVFTNTTGSKTSAGSGFSPPYQLTPDATTNLEATLRSQVGPQ